VDLGVELQELPQPIRMKKTINNKYLLLERPMKK
jgi:hypothetical protein